MRCLVKLLCFVIILVGVVTDANANKRIALVIGNSAYTDAGRLANPANDAADVSTALTRLGFEVVTGIDLTIDQFAETLVEFGNRAQNAKVALFYYAGHGIQYQGQNYLLPIDAELKNEFSIKRQTFNVTDILDQMEAASQVNLVFLDACRNNPLATTLKRGLRSRGRSASVGRGLARIKASENDTLLVYAAAPGSEAEDGTGRNSPFTSAFLKHVTTPGVEVEVLLKRVTRDVRAKTKERQRPERLSRLTVEFYFASGDAAKVTAEFQPQKPPGAAIPKQPKSSQSEAAEAWVVIRETEDPLVLESFIARYGQTFYGTLARQRLTKVKKKLAAVNPAASTRLVGSYSARGTNPNGSRYSGNVRIWTEGNTYRMRWDIAGKVYSGKGKLVGNTLTIDWGAAYPVIYKVGKNGVLHGRWSKGGKGRETLSPKR